MDVTIGRSACRGRLMKEEEGCREECSRDR